MTLAPPYFIDSDIFITAKNSYYGFKICPGFWKILLHYHQKKRIYSIDKVKSELLAGQSKEDLVQWVKEEVPQSFFLSVNRNEIIHAYMEIITWASNCSVYSDSAKAKFAKSADGWLVACAKVHNGVVVTNEKSAPNSKKI